MIIGDTGRTAITADAEQERIFEAYFVGGFLDGVTFELLESELTPEERANEKEAAA
jgi:hypothetical protein